MKIDGKILRVLSNAKKREFVVETKKGKYIFPYSQLKVIPSQTDPIINLYVDKETGSSAFTYELKSGKQASILLDNVLWLNQDPETLRRLLLSDLTYQANKQIKLKKIAKRFLVRKLNTSTSQLYRLLDQTYYNKTIDQMLKLLIALGIELEIKTKIAA